MTIYILSAGRSGSGWLATALMACGYSVVHEWTPASELNPEVVADTSLIWHADGFVRALKPEDVVILLERPRKAIEKSVEGILGPGSWDTVFEHWDRLKTLCRASAGHLVAVSYDELFTDKGRDKVYDALLRASTTKAPSPDRLDQVWTFMRHMRVTNLTAERLVKESHGL